MAEPNEFEILFNLSPDLLCVAGMDGYFQRINPAFSKLLGYSDEELLANSFLDLVHPEDVEKTLEEIETLKACKPSVNFENRYRHKDGHYIWLSWAATPDVDAGKVYAVARDVTAERLATQELQQLQAALKSETIFARTDKNGVIVEVNEKFCDVSGYSAEELIGQTHSIVNSGTHPPEFFEQMWRQIASGSNWSGLIQNRKKTGEDYFVYTVIAPVANADAKIQNYVAFRFDITDQINAQKDRDRILKILNETGSIAKVGGWELDIASGQLFWTDETFKILEVDKKDDQRPILPEGLDLFTPASKPIIEQAVARGIEFGEPYALELEALTAKGKPLWVFTNGKANYRDGKIVSLSGTIQDIDDKRQADNQLKVALERAEAANIAKSQFLANMSHEFRTPLNAIIGFSDAIIANVIDPADDQKIREYINDINMSGQVLLNLINSILDISRIESGKEEVQPVETDVRSALSECTELISILAKEKEIDLRVECPGDLPPIGADPRHFRQIIINLVSNAIKYTPEKGSVLCSAYLYRKGVISIEIKDTGIGIRKNEISRIFEAFERSAHAFSAQEQGSGLGLTLAKKLTELNGGSISIESERGSGTTVSLNFRAYSLT